MGTVTTGRCGPYRWTGTALGEPARVEAVAGSEHAIEAGRARLRELEDTWRPGRRGELARLAAHPGVMVAVSTDTVLLAERVNRGNRRRRLLVDARHGMIGRLDDAALDVDAAARALACELVLRAVLDAGADAAVVQIGGYGLRSTPAPDLAAA